MNSCFCNSPRFDRHKVIMGPMYSARVIMLAFMYGSSMWSIKVWSGIPPGLCTSCTLPCLSYTIYDTLGTVVITLISNSRSKRSCTISICNRPKKPQRKPKPNAADDSGVNVSEASFSCNFSSEARRSS